MSGDERKACWDLKYEEGLPSLTEPDPFFISACGQFVAPSFPRAGVALDLASGLGRHALWLASRSWQVTVVDLSDVAIGKLRQSALEVGVKVDLFVGDAAKFKFESARFDLIVLFYHLDRSLFPKIVSALKPGGLLISKMSLRWNSGEKLTTVSTDPLNRAELPFLVPELEVLYHLERPLRDRGVVEFVGRKSENAQALGMDPDKATKLRQVRFDLQES
jgi:SAM-dependent methyltransferase